MIASSLPAFFLLALFSCDSFSRVVVDNETTGAITVELSANEPFAWRLCEEAHVSGAGDDDVTSVTQELPTHGCLTMDIGSVSCADDGVRRLERVVVQRNGAGCLQLEREALHAVFSGDCGEQRWVVTDDACGGT